MTRTMIRTLALFAVVAAGCAENAASGSGPRTIVRNEEKSSEAAGIPPDKEAEIQLLLQQRNPSTLKCYSDVLNEKHDRAFKGTVVVLLTLEPSGSNSKASNVKIIGTFPEDTHPPIIYPIAITASATHPDAAAFLAYLKSTKAKPLFEAQGFTVLSNERS